MNRINDLVRKLDACPKGAEAWSRFEDLGTETLEYLFVPPLGPALRQGRTYSGLQRRDAIFPNRNTTAGNDPGAKNWHHLLTELGARMILVEFKNHDKQNIGKEEVNQTRNYMTAPMGRLAIMICSKEPSDSAHRQRNAVFTQEKKLILFITREHLKEMICMKKRGEEPSNLLMDLVERFYIQHE